jgi:two-component system sensor histidine kinase ChvG
MVHEIDRVDAFVRQLLALADQPSTLQPTDVTLVLDEAIALARQEIMHAGKEQKLAEVRLERLIDPLPPLMLEGARLAQAFARILQNAWEFTPAGGTITLAAAPAWDGGVGRCEVRIHNTGSAVAAHMMEKIFEPFVTTRDRATGLGLTIANQIIAQNGGTLGVHNEADGVSFVATFDLARVARPGDAAAHTALATGGKGPC